MAPAPDAKSQSSKFPMSVQSATGLRPGPAQQFVARPEKRCPRERQHSLLPWRPYWWIQFCSSDAGAWQKSYLAIVERAYLAKADRVRTSDCIRLRDVPQYRLPDRAVAEPGAKLRNGWCQFPPRSW